MYADRELQKDVGWRKWWPPLSNAIDHDHLIGFAMRNRHRHAVAAASRRIEEADPSIPGELIPYALVWLDPRNSPMLQNSKSERPQNSRDEMKGATFAIRIVLKANGKLPG